MREIKFRGMAVVNDKHTGIKVGDWVFGQFIQSGVDAPCIIFGDGEQIEIDRNTLGQFTGREDFEGVEIYEGDYVSSDFYEPDFKEVGEIVYDQYRMKFLVNSLERDAFEYGNLTVCGNIFQKT